MFDFGYRSALFVVLGKVLIKKFRAPLGKYIAGAPMDRVATDITGPFPISERGYRYVLVVQDQFSKWVEAYPIKDQSAETVAHVLFTSFSQGWDYPLNYILTKEVILVQNFSERFARRLTFIKREQAHTIHLGTGWLKRLTRLY